MPTNTSREAIREELTRAGYQQGHKGETGSECADCEKNTSGLRGWWKKTSYEYDEWECLCRDCAYKELHQWDDFDPVEYEKAASAV